MAIRATAVFDTRALCFSAMEVTARQNTPVEHHTACLYAEMSLTSFVSVSPGWSHPKH